jgi:PAS domain S-box-containing protein
MTWTKETYILHGLDPNKEQNKSNEIIKKSLSCYIGEGRARIEEAFRQCVKNGIPYDMVLPFQKFSGEKIWIRTTAKNLSEKGAKNRIIGNIMDVTDIKEFQEKLDISRKSYEDIFNSVFEAIYIQEVDGTFINVNRTAELLHNMQKEQMIGLNPKDIGVENLNDYKMIDRKMHHTFNTAETSHLEFWALRQGEEYFPEEITINKGKYFEKDVIIATGRDISERMREEIVRNAQLRLIEYSADHRVKELLTKFLDDTEKITNSSIGFYHFLKENQKDIARSIWSTRTKNTLSQMGVSSSFCHPLKKEGNWFRCISEKKPVIQNDYQKTANHNQMPKDHVCIERELVVPVIRNKKILAVLGLGNKPSNYTENDLKTVQKLADLAWETVERKRIEEKLIKSEQRLRTIINAVPSMIFVNNRDGKILSANDAMADILGVKVTEIFGKSHIELFKNSDLARKTSEVTKRVIESGETEEFISELTNHKGEKKWIHSVITPYEGDDFGELAVLGVSADITNLKKAEQSIQKSEEQFRTLVTNLPGIAFRCLNDVNWTMLYFSEKASEITGYKNTDFIKNKVRSYSSIIHPEDREKVRKKVEKSIETSTIYSIEYRILCADGSIKWVMEKGQGITDKKGKLHYIDGVIMDITQNKKSEKERAKLEEKLRRTQKLETIGTLAGGIAHDFNNILTPIMGYSDMALAKMQPYNPIYDDLQHILKASIRAKELVKQILVFSRQLETEHKPLKLHLIVNEALKLLRPSIPSTIKINLNLDKDASFIDADPAQIHQIIINLCTNSFHAMEGSGGELTIDLTEVEIDRQTANVYENLEEKKYVKLSIKDTGHGMDKMLVERIFEPFFTTKSVEKGTGMGLSVVHGIVRDHNGEITVYSEPGKGTVFHIYFPAVENIEKEEIEEKEEISVGNENILIVDDEEAITKMSKKMLSYIGYKVDVVNNSKVALKMLLDNPSKYHLLITDLTMPELTGIDLAKNLYDNGVKLPIIIMTGYGDQISVEEQNKYNIKKIISKPLIYNDFAKEIRNIFNET